jgi:DNA-binding transcriptional regulator YhcF (GntR family)
MPASSSADLDRLDLDLKLVLDRDAEVPIGVQLAWALRARLRDGTLLPGQRLPGLRDLATALHINANTVRAVYQRLEHEGIIVSRQGSGTFVADTPLQAPSPAGAIAAQAARAALDTGVDPRDVAAALYVAPVAVAAATDAAAVVATPSAAVAVASSAAVAATPAPGAPTAAKTSVRSAGSRPTGGTSLTARRRQLRAQIAALQRTLGELETRHPALVLMPTEPTGPAGPRLLDVGELEQVQALLIARLTTLHAAIDKVAARASSSASDSGDSREIQQADKAPHRHAGKDSRRASRSGRARGANATASASASVSAPKATRVRPAPAGA